MQGLVDLTVVLAAGWRFLANTDGALFDKEPMAAVTITGPAIQGPRRKPATAAE